jgi:hypothetical protein
MFKKILLVVLAAVTILTMVGCGSSGPNREMVEPPAPKVEEETLGASPHFDRETMEGFHVSTGVINPYELTEQERAILALSLEDFLASPPEVKAQDWYIRYSSAVDSMEKNRAANDPDSLLSQARFGFSMNPVDLRQYDALTSTAEDLINARHSVFMDGYYCYTAYIPHAYVFGAVDGVVDFGLITDLSQFRKRNGMINWSEYTIESRLLAKGLSEGSDLELADAPGYAPLMGGPQDGDRYKFVVEDRGVADGHRTMLVEYSNSIYILEAFNQTASVITLDGEVTFTIPMFQITEVIR